MGTTYSFKPDENFFPVKMIYTQLKPLKESTQDGDESAFFILMFREKQFYFRPNPNSPATPFASLLYERKGKVGEA